jgi:tRNA A37 threonylcarbamoyladenosine synthetase subunit TsaC/SUA5/YrdC
MCDGSVLFFFGAIIKSNSCLKDTFNSSILVAIGFLISNPTDTVQGLTCLPYEKSMQKMLWLKRRSPAKGLILLHI